MPFDLKKCTEDCNKCVFSYIKKHRLTRGNKFEIDCGGIPQEYLSKEILAEIDTDPQVAIAMFDPVSWAAQFLDWHCIDPDGAIWKRKTEDGSLPANYPRYDKEKACAGKSILHRPYQAVILRCSSKRKVMRVGRQAGKTEALCVAALFAAYTNANFRIVIIAPYQSQVDLIFERLKNMLESSAVVANSIQSAVKAPNHKIQLKNSSVIVGFTAGTKSKNEAGSVRGQPANMLVFDEMDMLSSADINSALATILNFPEATVWASSTPTGRRDRFYEVCKNPMYREFHYPSQVNPNWDQATEKHFRNELTEDGYKHEVEAEFGDQEEGVYQHKYIEAAQGLYKYGDHQPSQNWSYMIGVDWNDPKIGTTIAIVGYNYLQNLFYLVDKYIISRGDRTQLAACDKIAELNRYWNPESIYVDRGYGTTQIEVLREYGQKAIISQGASSSDAQLLHRIKPFDFGGTIEIRDLVTKQPVNKHAKPFLVENSVRRFEQFNFKYPREDNSFTEQLQGYIVDRVTDTGRFVYKPQNEKAGDHFLDAVNLALVAFTLEKTDLGKVKFNASIAFTASGLISGESHSDQKNVSRIDVSGDYRPKSGRALEVSKNQLALPGFASENGKLPASNTSGDLKNNKLWSWPGWTSDLPPPSKKDYNHTNPFRSNRGHNKPQRKKF